MPYWKIVFTERHETDTQMADNDGYIQ